MAALVSYTTRWDTIGQCVVAVTSRIRDYGDRARPALTSQSKDERESGNAQA